MSSKGLDLPTWRLDFLKPCNCRGSSQLLQPSWLTSTPHLGNGWLLQLVSLCRHALLSSYKFLDVLPATLGLGESRLSQIWYFLISSIRADNGTHWDCTGGAARFIDVTVFGEEHIYQSPTSHHIYGGAAHDPEGLLGTLNRWPFIKSMLP